MRNICFIAENLTGGGAERVVSLLCNELSERGYKVSIITNVYEKIAYDISSDVSIYPLYSEQEAKTNNLKKLFYSVNKNGNK